MVSILHIDSSAQNEGSITRKIGAELVQRLNGDVVMYRDLAKETPGLVDETWVAANFTPPSDRDQIMQDKLAESDKLVDELMAADVVVIGAPVYNFSVPSTLKAWIDMVGRVHRTFKYSATGPVGLLQGKRAIIVTATGGMPVGSDYDFASPYLRHFLGFMGINNVAIVAAEKGDQGSAMAQIESLVAERYENDVEAAETVSVQA